MSVRSEVLEALELQVVYLHDCSIERTDTPSEAPPTKATLDSAFGHAEVDAGRLIYLVSLKCEFRNDADDILLTLRVKLGAGYQVAPGTALETSDFEAYGNECVVFQVHPYLREFVASMTVRLGLPPYTLPILRVGQPD